MTTPDDMTSFAPAENAEALRSAFGRFGTGVIIITTQSEIGPLGMTANSFTSVSLDPPLVLWSAALRSKRHDAFALTDHFAIHVLGMDQQGLAQHFARQGDGFDTLAWAEGPRGAPTIAGCLAVFHCDRFAVHPGGDHSVILGQVTHAAERNGSGAGLLFDRGRFGHFSAGAEG